MKPSFQFIKDCEREGRGRLIIEDIRKLDNFFPTCFWLLVPNGHDADLTVLCAIQNLIKKVTSFYFTVM